MSRIAYVNGAYLPQSQACVNIEDRGYQFADAIYEVLHILDGKFIDEDRHLARLDRSLAAIRIAPPMPRAALRHVLAEMVRRNRVLHGLIYIQVSRGVARRDHAFPPAGTQPALVMTVRRLPPFPRDAARWTGSAITVPDERWARCDIKSVNLLPNVLARQAARDRGATEAIMIRDGQVMEGASTSVWAVCADGVLRTRQLDRAILPGCTRAALLDLIARSGIAAEERAILLDELRAAREIFLTSATSFVKPMLALDGAPVGDGAPGPVAARLFDLFARHIRGNR